MSFSIPFVVVLHLLSSIRNTAIVPLPIDLIAGPTSLGRDQ